MAGTEKKYYHRKLVRDKIPGTIRSLGGSCETRILGDEEFSLRLREKLVEESKEVIVAPKEELIEELADVLQLVHSIAEFEEVSIEQIEKERKKKVRKRGAFKKKRFLIWSNKPSGTK